MRRNDVIALIVILCMGALLAVIVLPQLGRRSGDSRPATNMTQLRGIHQSFVIYAQGNKGNYPGLDGSGSVIDPTLSGQFATLLDGNYFTPEYLINPMDRAVTEAIDYGSGYVVSVFNHSYAGLDLSVPGGRRNAWSETLDTQEVVLGDRNIGPDPHANTRSVWSDPSEHWRGGIIRNDNSTSFEVTHVVETAYTEPSTRSGAATAKSGTRHFHIADNLFNAAGPHDAWLVHD